MAGGWRESEWKQDHYCGVYDTVYLVALDEEFTCVVDETEGLHWYGFTNPIHYLTQPQGKVLGGRNSLNQQLQHRTFSLSTPPPTHTHTHTHQPNQRLLSKLATHNCVYFPPLTLDLWELVTRSL